MKEDTLNNIEGLLTADELADILKVKISTIREWTHTNYVPHIKFGRLVRFSEHDITKWLEEKKVQSNAFA